MLLLGLLVLPHLKRKLNKKVRPQLHRTCVVSKRKVGRTIRRDSEVPNDIEVGHMARNELDTHADTSCAVANWVLLEYTGEICEVSPFLTTYDPIQEIPVARCCTVWTSDQTGIDYLLIGDQMLWFGTSLRIHF